MKAVWQGTVVAEDQTAYGTPSAADQKTVSRKPAKRSP